MPKWKAVSQVNRHTLAIQGFSRRVCTQFASARWIGSVNTRSTSSAKIAEATIKPKTRPMCIPAYAASAICFNVT